MIKQIVETHIILLTLLQLHLNGFLVFKKINDDIHCYSLHSKSYTYIKKKRKLFRIVIVKYLLKI